MREFLKKSARLILSALAAFWGGTVLGVVYPPGFPLLALFSLVGVFGVGPLFAILLWALKKYSLEHFILCGVFSGIFSVACFLIAPVLLRDKSESIEPFIVVIVIFGFPALLVSMIIGAISGALSYLVWSESRHHLMGTSLVIMLVSVIAAVRVFDEVYALLF